MTITLVIEVSLDVAKRLHDGADLYDSLNPVLHGIGMALDLPSNDDGGYSGLDWSFAEKGERNV